MGLVLFTVAVFACRKYFRYLHMINNRFALAKLVWHHQKTIEKFELVDF